MRHDYSYECHWKGKFCQSDAMMNFNKKNFVYYNPFNLASKICELTHQH